MTSTPVANFDTSRMTPSVVPNRKRRVVTSAALALAASVLSACGNPFSHVETKHFDTRSDAPTSGDLAFVLPSFIPVDATAITVHVDAESPDSKMYDWKSVSGELPAACQATTGPWQPEPFDKDEWPTAVSTANGWTCGARPTQVRQVDDRFFAW